MKKKPASSPSWLVCLLGLPFATAGIGVLVFSILPNLFNWYGMQSWNPVQAQLLSANLEVMYGDDSTSYQAIASYHYRFANTDYTNNRVGVSPGSDNIGSWQEDKAAELKRALQYKKPITIYVNPKNPGESIIYRDLRLGLMVFKFIFSIIFGAIGLGLMYAGFRGSDNIDKAALDSDQPWLADKSWQNPITSNAKSGMWSAWAFTAFWNVIAIPISISVLSENLPKENYIALAILVFPLAGVLLLKWAIKSTRDWRHFGMSPLWMDPYPGAIGGQVGGTIKLQQRKLQQRKLQQRKLQQRKRQQYKPQKRLQPQPVNITLQCIYHYSTGSGDSQRSCEDIVWSKQGKALIEATGQGSDIKFCFDVPKNLPASEVASSCYHQWQLEVEFTDNKITFDRRFTLPVFPSDQQSTLNISETDESHLTRDEHQQKLEALLNVTQISGGIALNHEMGRNAKSKIIFLLVGVIMGVRAFICWLKRMHLL